MTQVSHRWKEVTQAGMGVGGWREGKCLRIYGWSENSINLSFLGMGPFSWAPMSGCPDIEAVRISEGMETTFNRSWYAMKDMWKWDLPGERHSFSVFL